MKLFEILIILLLKDYLRKIVLLFINKINVNEQILNIWNVNRYKDKWMKFVYLR